MQIAFHKLPGVPALGLACFWRLTLTTPRPQTITDHLIPELFLDYLLVRRGQVIVNGPHQKISVHLPPQSLKTLHTRPLRLTYRTPLDLYGARLALPFAEWFWEPCLPAQSFLPQRWVARPPADLATFASQVTAMVAGRRARKTPYPMLTPSLEESNWLASYSSRHKRRLYQSVFGLSRRQLLQLRAVHAFLEQACDFDTHWPRVIEFVNADHFYDQPHFNRAFKTLTGFSPLDYFQTNFILQDNLMAASYNAPTVERTTL
jgi:AraC-like DNA-binding protein